VEAVNFLGKKWVVQDRYGNTIYLSDERWQHIIHPDNHPEMDNYSEHLKETIRTGVRRQAPLNPRKYRYVKYCDDLANGNNHIVAIVFFKFDVDEEGNTIENSFILTAYQKYIGHRR